MNGRTARLLRRYCSVANTAAREAAEKSGIKPQQLSYRRFKRAWSRLPAVLRAQKRIKLQAQVEELA